MTKASDNAFPTLILVEGAAPATPASGQVKLYVKADGLLYWKDDAGTEYAVSSGASGIPATIVDAKGDLIVATAADTVARRAVGTNGQVLTADSAESTGVKWATPSAGSDVGLSVIVAPPFYTPTTANSNNADLAWAIPINVPSAMLLRGMAIRAGTGAAGSVQWGLFDYTTTPTAATKLAGGSGALATGITELLDAGAPVSIAAGNYMAVIHQPSATQPSITHQSLVTAGSIVKLIDPYTWDDTPDFTTGWADTSVLPLFYLFGDLKSGTAW